MWCYTLGMHKRGFIDILLALIVVILVGGMAYFIANKQVAVPNPLPVPSPTPTPTPAPVPEPGSTQVILHEGERDGSLYVEKIYTDYITGLNYWEYPVAREQGSPITLKIGETASNGCTVTMTLIKIDGKTATFIKKVDNDRPCPICLSGNTLIATPSGDVAVKDIKMGMKVWTLDAKAKRVVGLVLKTGITDFETSHTMIELTFSDGGNILVSPGHPLIDGRVISDLEVGDVYGEAKVTSIKYKESLESTYDILISGSTSFYFANGIVLGSTLRVGI